MRLIDADALIDNLELMYEHRDDKDEPYNIGVRGAINMTRKAPTIEPKRGEWIEHEGRTIVGDNNFIDFFPTEYECSNCGLRQATYFINSTLPNFCPNCGADMRKERE